MQYNAARLWQSRRIIQRKDWPDGTVLYDTASGDTHHLSPLAARIQALLGDRSLSREELAHSVLSSAPAFECDDPVAEVDAILANLAQLGLIEPK